MALDSQVICKIEENSRAYHFADGLWILIWKKKLKDMEEEAEDIYCSNSKNLLTSFTVMPALCLGLREILGRLPLQGWYRLSCRHLYQFRFICNDWL